MASARNKYYGVNEVIDIVTNWDESNFEDSEEVEFEVTILPPTVRADAETDCDSDASDDQNEGLIHHLPRHLIEFSLHKHSP